MRFETKNSLDKIICTTEYQNKQNWIYSDWEGFSNLDAIKKWGAEFISMISTYNCPYYLCNAQKTTGPWLQSIDWVQSELLPKVTDAGLKYYAHVVSHNTFSDLSAKELNNCIEGELEMVRFQTLEEASAWLKSKQEKNNYYQK